MTDIPHGTYAGLQRHKKLSEEPCRACKKAGAEYQAERRRASPQMRSNEALVLKAADKARRRLAQIHLAEYRKLFAEEKARLRAERRGGT